MGKKKEIKFRIGDKVEVDALRNSVMAIYVPKHKPSANGVKERDYRKLVRYCETVDDPEGEGAGYTLPSEFKLGVITGIKILCEGWYYAAERTYNYSFMAPDDGPDPGGLEVEKIHYLWCVRFGYANKEHYFFEEDIKRFLNHSSDYLKRPMHIPFKDTGWNSSLVKKCKEGMSRESKNWPRDSKGRWVKEKH